MADRKQAEKRGRRSEYFAAISLVLKGYSILELRYKTPMGEVDIIARRGRLIAFVEVKARSSIDEAVSSVTYKSRQRICAAGEAYLSRHRLDDFEQRYDVIAVRPWRWPAHVRDAWRAGD